MGSAHDSRNPRPAITGAGDADPSVYAGLLSAAPLGLKACDELPNSYQSYWEHGTTDGVPPDETYPNPTRSESPRCQCAD